MKEKIIHHLEFIARLLELNNENEFKIKSYKKASDCIYYAELNEETITDTKWNNISGIGASISKTIEEFVLTSNSEVNKKLLSKTPEQIIELSSSIRGIGLKTVSMLWHKHNIKSIEELLEKCNNNELIKIKGFGEAWQEKIKARILFYYNNKGKVIYHKAADRATELLSQLNKFTATKNNLTGQIAQHLPIINQTEIVSTATPEKITELLNILNFKIELQNNTLIQAHNAYYGKVIIYLSKDDNFGNILFNTSSTDIFKTYFSLDKNYPSEDHIFIEKDITFVPAFLRDSEKYLNPKHKDEVLNYIGKNDIKGLIHCHSNWSDGESSIEKMAEACIKKGLQYMLITDHSEISVIANGLSKDRVISQHQEIDELNNKLAPFKIFKGIECDILADGSLDYGKEFLKKFDLVIASIHQNLDMPKEVATKRVLNAISNPATHIMGHISGRLLLNRQGYDLDYNVIFEACVKNNVAIEFNANPFRLDIDCQYLEQMRDHKIKTSINPDAHSIQAISDFEFATDVTQRSCLQKHDNISSYSLTEFKNYVEEMKGKNR